MTRDPLLDQNQLERYLHMNHLPPLARFGQHFLVDEDVLRTMAHASGAADNLPLIEIGPGLGVLTRMLCEEREHAKVRSPIIAVELDRRIIPLLRARVHDKPQVTIHAGDILHEYPRTLLPDNTHDYLVAGNIPYNITAKLLRHVLAWDPLPKRITFMMDAAVAKRITATPPNMSVLAIAVQVASEPLLVGPIIPPSAYVPPPKVSSAIVTLATRSAPLVPADEQRAFFQLVRAGFSQRRKTLQNTLRAFWRLSSAEAGKRLSTAGIDPARRAQTLTINEWLTLLRAQTTD